MPKVINSRHTKTKNENAVYIGRKSRWGNPFIVGKDGDRETVMKKYELWIHQQIVEDPGILEDIRYELSGKDLLCWCAPLACHGDILLKLANPEV